MNFNDEFDLDLVKSDNENGGISPQGVSEAITSALISMTVESVIQTCTDGCLTTACTTDCDSALTQCCMETAMCL